MAVFFIGCCTEMGILIVCSIPIMPYVPDAPGAVVSRRPEKVSEEWGTRANNDGVRTKGKSDARSTR